jgi:hypothetical protein
MNRNLSLGDSVAALISSAALVILAACSGSSAGSMGTAQAATLTPAAVTTSGSGSPSAGSGSPSGAGPATSMSGSSPSSGAASKSGSTSGAVSAGSGSPSGAGPTISMSGSSPSSGAASKSGSSSSTAATTSLSSTPVTSSSASASSTASTIAASSQSLSADTNRPNNSTYVPNEDIEVTFRATGLTASQTTSLAIKVIDELGTEIASTWLPMKADSSGRSSATFRAPSSKYGYYRVEATLPSGAVIANLGTRYRGFISYAVVADPAKRTNYGDALSRFGMQGGFNHDQGNVMAYLGARYLLDGPGWSDLEPNFPGQFAEARIAALAKGLTVPFKVADNSGTWPTFAIPLVTQASVPGWAMEPGTGTIAWPNMGVLNTTGTQGMSGFTKARAQQVATDYAGQSSHYYQVTWEPEIPGGWGGTPAQLVQFFQNSYTAIHQGDPKAIVMGPTMFPGDIAPMTKLWAAGLGNYLDAVSMHPYAAWPPETHGLVSDIRTQVKMAQSAKGHPIPFVGTEHGYASGPIGELNQALGNIRSTIILLGEGFKFDVAFYIADFWDHSPIETNTTYGYYWNLNPNIAYGTDKLGPKPAVPAFAAMTSMLDGTVSSGAISNLSGTQIGYRFERNGTAILALWDYQAAASTVTLPVPSQSLEICNWMGNCFNTASVTSILLSLRAEPIYIIGHGL